MMTEHSPQRSPTPDQLYALQAIQAKNNAGQELILNLGDHSGVTWTSHIHAHDWQHEQLAAAAFSDALLHVAFLCTCC